MVDLTGKQEREGDTAKAHMADWGMTLALFERLPPLSDGCNPGTTVTDIRSHVAENEIENEGKEMEGKARGDAGNATGNTTEHVMRDVEEAVDKVRPAFGMSEWKA
jgi:hypothetical protein